MDMSPRCESWITLNGMDGVLDSPRLESLITVAASAAIMPSEFLSGSRNPCDTTDNKSEGVFETRAYLDRLVAVIVVAGGKIGD